jgi:hypothetical protein
MNTDDRPQIVQPDDTSFTAAGAIPRPIGPRLSGSTTVVGSDEAAVTNAGDRPQRRSLEYVPTVLIEPPSSERAF